MTAASYDLTIEQGATFSRTLTVRENSSTPYNLTGWTGRGQIRTSHKAPDPTASFVVAVNDAVNGVLTFSLLATVTAGLAAREYVYDIEIAHVDGRVMRLLEGTATVTPEVTR